MRILWVLLLTIGLSPVVGARTIEGVHLADKIARDGQELVLNGAGIREKFFFDIYIAALYLPNKTQDARQVLQGRQPWRMIMHFLYSKVDTGKLDAGWDEGFEANLPKQKMAGMRDRLQTFKSLFRDMYKGDQVVLDYVPGAGVKVTINGKRAGQVKGDDFAAALMSVWLGRKPVTKSLKAELLGK